MTTEERTGHRQAGSDAGPAAEFGTGGMVPPAAFGAGEAGH
ncbi:hypothetical protein FHS23_002548 [Prauserella isguenensis]|uniref:Uncharacterized protein n=1 Tax=Prauserella isguenensis TaxID=1470180 RepID=A0A839S1L9_9PSEU|nr:hypothetical protein [Prauserella isguenensis]MBB3051525.1 hypothetical protein [Prauserella isguenensis]